eukprot:SAG25_NODE_7951_length_448_cov_1.776504_1_plen_53_part_10
MVGQWPGQPGAIKLHCPWANELAQQLLAGQSRPRRKSSRRITSSRSHRACPLV